MNPSVKIKELEIVIALKNNLPTNLLRKIILDKGIIPGDWQLASQPTYTSATLEIIFTNGVTFIAQAQRIILLETIEGKTNSQVLIPKIALKYVESLPNLDYYAVGINPKGYVNFGSKKDAARDYIDQTLLYSGPWQDFGQAKVRNSLNFTYTLESGFLNLSVNEAALRLQDETIVPIVLFSGNFDYNISSEDNHLRLPCLVQFLNDWQHKLEIYQDLINTRFLTKTNLTENLKTDLFYKGASVRD